MKKFKIFYFEKFSFDKNLLLAKFQYSFDNEYFFEEEIDFSSSDFVLREDLDDEIINNFLFNIHIAFWISYYKSFPTEFLVVKNWKLSNNQILFWEKFYKNGLWEFLYVNKINPENLFNFKVDSTLTYQKKDFNIKDKSLIPLWWWKDSLVSIDHFEKNKMDFDLYVFWKSDEIKENCAKEIWKKILLNKRKISENLIKLNSEWNYNWHVPITWLIAFVMVFEWYLYNYKNLVLSNEKSANSGNTFWSWFEINHQYSKSLEFEKDFKNYLNENITDKINYFSFLRWFYELNIAKYFSENCKKYFWVFSSCNKNFKIDINKRLSWWLWCNSCSKCAFVFCILRPYLSESEINIIFWEDLFYKKDLEKTFLELSWLEWIKPLECVWEEEEVIFSLYKSINLYNEYNLPNILKIFKEKILNKNNEDYFLKLENKFVRIYDEDIIPKKLKNKLLTKKDEK